MVIAALSEFKGYFQDAFDLRTMIDICIVSLFVVLVFLSEVHTTSQFTDDDEVSPFDEFFLQRALVEQAVESSHGAYVGKESEFLAHGQQTSLGTYLQCRIVVKTWITYSGEEHSVGVHTGLERLIGEGIPHGIDGVSTTDSFVIRKLMVELLGHSIQYMKCLRHDLRSDTVAGENGNV